MAIRVAPKIDEKQLVKPDRASVIKCITSYLGKPNSDHELNVKQRTAAHKDRLTRAWNLLLDAGQSMVAARRCLPDGREPDARRVALAAKHIANLSKRCGEIIGIYGDGAIERDYARLLRNAPLPVKHDVSAVVGEIMYLLKYRGDHVTLYRDKKGEPTLRLTAKDVVLENDGEEYYYGDIHCDMSVLGRHMVFGAGKGSPIAESGGGYIHPHIYHGGDACQGGLSCYTSESSMSLVIRAEAIMLFMTSYETERGVYKKLDCWRAAHRRCKVCGEWGKLDQVRKTAKQNVLACRQCTVEGRLGLVLRDRAVDLEGYGLVDKDDIKYTLGVPYGDFSRMRFSIGADLSQSVSYTEAGYTGLLATCSVTKLIGNVAGEYKPGMDIDDAHWSTIYSVDGEYVSSLAMEWYLNFTGKAERYGKAESKKTGVSTGTKAEAIPEEAVAAR